MEKSNWSGSLIMRSYGIPLGLLLIVITLFAYLVDIDKEKWLGIVVFVFLEVAIIYCINDVKKNIQESVTFGIAFKSAFYMSFIAIFISSIYFFIHINYVDTHYIDAMIELQKNEMLKGGMSEETAIKAVNMSAAFNTPIAMTGIGFAVNLIVSSILSAITAAVMKQE